LIEERDRIKALLREIQRKADRLVTALESGEVTIGRIENRLKDLETEEKALRNQLEVKEFEVQSRENDSVSAELVIPFQKIGVTSSDFAISGKSSIYSDLS